MQCTLLLQSCKVCGARFRAGPQAGIACKGVPPHVMCQCYAAASIKCLLRRAPSEASAQKGTQKRVCRARRYVWLNQFADQFVPILALLALRIVVGVGDAVLKRFSKPKKGAMQARLPHLPQVHRCLCNQPHGFEQIVCAAQS